MYKSKLCICGLHARLLHLYLVWKWFAGMNLVAKEFVACQTKNPGVLILSPFTGAGETMHEALIVNPLEVNMLSETIHRALTMPLVGLVLWLIEYLIQDTINKSS